MATTSVKSDNSDAAEENIDEILSAIKGVITSSSALSNVLVLTEQVEEELKSTSANSTDKELPKEPNANLVRDDIALAVQAAISHMLHAEDSKYIQNSTNTPLLASKSLEDITIDLLRAELQNWLNANLERMVKSIVESEIKRIMPK